MAKKKSTPHLDAWLRTFKKVGSTSAKLAGGTLKSMAPGISETVESSVEVMNESRKFINENKSKIRQQTRALSNTLAGRDAKSVLNDAFNDIKSGNFSLGKLTDNSMDIMDDFDIDFDMSNVDTSDSGAVAIAESKRNTALLGKAVTEGNIATIEGMQNMTETLANVTIKSSSAATTQMSNVIMMGMGQTHKYLNGITNRLDNINMNLSTLIEFNNKNVYQTNQAAIEFYSEASQMMNNMGQAITEMQDFITQQKAIEKKHDKVYSDDYNFSNGFNMSNYVKFVKNNFKNSSLGMGASMGGSMFSMMTSLGMNPMELILTEFALPMLIPGRVKRSISRTDKMFTAGINELLYRIGDKRYSGNEFSRFFGRYFGKERPTSITKANMGDFKKDAMGWNGIAQRTLVEVIPSYLAKIESSLTKQEERFYNMDTGLFQTRSQTEADFTSNFDSIATSRMREFADKVSETLKKSSISSAESQKIYDYINTMTYNHTKGEGDRKNDIQQMIDMLKPYVNGNDIRDITIQYNSDLQDTIKSLKDVISDMDSVSQSANRHLFNQKGKSSSDYYKKGNLFSGREMTDDGRFVDDMTDAERRAYQADKEDSKRWSDRIRRYKNKVRRKFGKAELTEEDERRIKNGSFGPIDRMSNFMWDRMSGFDYSNTRSSNRSNMYDFNPSNQTDFVIVGGPITPNDRKATSNIERNKRRSSSKSNLQSQIAKISSGSFRTTLNQNPAQVQRESASLDSMIKETENKPSDFGNNLPAVIEQQTTSLQTLVLSLHHNFLKPLTTSIFGKQGLIGKMFSNDKKKALKKTLFDEKEGIFGGFTSKMKDTFDYAKYIFNGKGYTDRSGKSYPDEKNSVFGHLTNGYDFIFSNTMKYIFGNDYKSNKTFNKYFSWMDIKGRQNRKNTLAIEDKTAGLNEYVVEEPLLLEDKSLNKNASFELMSPSEAKEIRDKMSTNLILASETASTQLVEASTALSTEVIGDFSDKSKNEIIQKEANETIMSSIKKHLPRSLAAGTVGAIVGTSLGLHGTGLIGSMFLPGGPVGGAIAGIGLEILSRSKGFNKFLFGEMDKDGKRQGGLISNKMQNFVKSNLPLIVGTSAIGALKGMIKTSVVGGPTGFLLNTLLPGGPIGGAVLGLGIGLMKNNEKFKKILFGEEGEDGKKHGGFFSKFGGIFGRVFEKSGNFIKGGLKGAGIATLSGITLSKFGLLGSAMTMGGPIGMGLAGLGIGIASQTKKFQELLFGTEEFDENGNLKGRMKNGLFTKVRNMLVFNVFEPIKNKLDDKTEDFAIWAKKSIVFPFRLAFGPILDSMKGIKKNIEDTIHDTFNNIANSVTDAIKGSLKTIFKPFSKMIGGAGNMFANALSSALKLSLSPITGSLKLLQFATLPKRVKAKMRENGNILSNLGEIYYGARSVWDREDDSQYGSGLMGRFRKIRSHVGDLKQGVDAAKYAYEHELQAQGFNSLNWMNVGREKKDLNADVKRIKKNRKKWEKIRSYRQGLVNDNEYGEARYSDEKIASINKDLSKLGLKKEITSNEDLNNFLYNYIDWKDKYDAKKDGDAAAYIARNGVTINENDEVKRARKGTESYQRFVMDKFNEITKYFTKMAAKESLEKKRNIDITDLKDLDADLKANGLTWDDVGVDPADLVNMGSINDDDWDEFLKAKFESGDLNKSRNAYTNMFRNIFNGNKSDSAGINLDNIERVTGEEVYDEKDYQEILGQILNNGITSDSNSNRSNINMSNIERVVGEEISDDEYQSILNRRSGRKARSSDEATIIDTTFRDVSDSQVAMLEELRQIKDSTVNQEIFEGEQAMAQSGVSASTLNRVAGKRYTSRQMSFMMNYAKTQAAKLRASREEAESEKARGLSGSSESEKMLPAVIENVTEEEDVKETAKQGLLGSIKGFFGSIFSFVTSGSFWKKAGIAAVIYGLFGESINKLCGSLWDAIVPTVKKAFNAVTTWWDTNGSKVISGITETICNNMGTLISNATKIIWSAVTTTAKLAVNALTKKIVGYEFFGDVSTSKTETFDSLEEATEKADLLGKNVYVDDEGTAMILGSGEDVDSDGNVKSIRSGSLTHSVGREAIRFATSSTNRNMAKATVKGATKAAGWLSGITPVTRVARAGFRGIKSVGTGVADIVKTGKNYYATKAAAKLGTEATEEIIETNLENSLKTTGRNIAKDGAKSTVKSGIKAFLAKAKNILKGALKFIKKHIPGKKFFSFVENFIKELGEKIFKSDNALLKKISEKIAIKSAEATGRTVADATVILGVGFAIYDGINGFLDAAYLFGINSDDVTVGMRTVSSIMHILLGTAPGAWIDIMLEIYAMITGNNAKQWFARKLYCFVPGSDEEGLEEAITELEVETEKYNKANNTNLTTNDYNEKKNSSTTIWGRVKKNGSWLLSKATFWTSSDDKSWDEKYDYSKYEVSDAELQAAINLKNSSDYSVDTSSAEVDSYDGSDIVNYGPGMRKVRTKSVGYGSYRQDDSRWANYSLGKFPNGTDSTMATGGCGPTALATVASNLGANTTPMSVAQYAKASGYIKDGGATSGLFTNGASSLGLSAKKVDKGSIKNSLSNGEQVVLSGKSTSSNSPYTSAGHIIVASGMDSKGNVIVNDPMSGSSAMSLNTVTDGMTNGWSYTKSVGYGTTTTPPSPLQPPTSPAPSSTSEPTSSSSNTTKRSTDVTGGYYLPAAGPSPEANKPGYTQTFQYVAKLANGETKTINTTNANISLKEASKKTAIIGPETEIDFLMSNYCTIKTKTDMKKKIENGKKKSSDKKFFKFNTAGFYNNLNVADIKAMYLYDKTLFSNYLYPLLSEVYEYFVTSGYYQLSDTIKKSVVQDMKNKAGFDTLLGGSGTVNDYEYKNGFPFFRLNDDRWSDIVWRDSKVSKRGSDLAALSMVASGFGDSLLPPDYVYTNWLQTHPEWWTSNEGLDTDIVYSDTGYNVMSSTQVEGNKVIPTKVSSVKNYNTIISAMKNKKPVVLTGYKYDGSIFGGKGSKSTINTSDPDSYGSVVGLYANDAYMAVNDPNTGLTDNSIFTTNLLKDTLSNNSSVIKNAYIISGPNGEGATLPVDLTQKNIPESDYEDMSVEKQGALGAISNMIKNFASIGKNMLESLLGGNDYKSIYDSVLEGDEDTSKSGASSEAGVDATNPYAIPEDYLKEEAANEAIKNAKTYYDNKQKRILQKYIDENKGTWTVKDRNGSVWATCSSKAEAKSYLNGGSYLHGLNVDPSTLYLVNAESGETYDPNGILTGKKTSEVVTRKSSSNGATPLAGISLALGGGNRDFNIGYGIGTNILDNVNKELGAINYANQARLLGKSYKKAKAEYFANLSASDSSTSTVSTDGSSSATWTTTESADGTEKAVPSGFGKTMSYMDWDLITSPSSTQMKLINDAGKSFDENGLGMVGDRYTVAVKPYFGTIGDYLNVKFEDGTIVKAIVADQKGRENEPGGNLYSAASNATQRSMGVTDKVHTDGSVVEWVLDGHGRRGSGAFSGYGGSKTVAKLHPEWHQNISSITKVGNYWKDSSANNKVNYGRGTAVIGYGPGNWLGTVIAVKQAIAAQRPGYSQSRSISVTIDGVTKSVRTDCSGFVSACLQFYGVNIPTLSSRNYTNDSLGVLDSAGFHKTRFTNWESLQPGDIIARDGHVEIFCKIEDGRHYVYNCGSSNSVNNPNATISGHSSYTTVWRPTNAGSMLSTSIIGDTTSQQNTSSISTFASPLDSMISGLNQTVSVMAANSLGYGPDSPASWFTNTLGGQVTSGYGRRNSAFGNEFHRGLDIGAAKGSHIPSPVNGTVVAKGNDVAGYGNYAVVRDNSGNNHIFAHMNKGVGYGIGDKISKSDIIGEVGSTGKASGDHLHYEIRKSGNKYSTIDPTSYRYGNDNNVSKSLNIQSYNNAIGSGNKDIATDNVNTLNVALKTNNVEDKIDSLIEVMKSWAERDKETQRTNNINQINNNTTVSYGTGGKSKIMKKSTSSSSKINETTKSLIDIHKSIAAK